MRQLLINNQQLFDYYGDTCCHGKYLKYDYDLYLPGSYTRDRSKWRKENIGESKRRYPAGWFIRTR